MIQMSATFYPATQGTSPGHPELHLQKEDRWEYVPDIPEVNLSNFNARFVLEALGLDPNFEKSDTSTQTIDDFIERCHVVLHGGIPDGALISMGSRDAERYILHRVAMLLVSAELGRHSGATHWYFA